MRVLDWEAAGVIAEMRVDAVCEKQGNIAKKSTMQTNRIRGDETGKDGLPLDWFLLCIQQVLQSSYTSISLLSRQLYVSIFQKLWYIFCQRSRHEAKASQHNVTLRWAADETESRHISRTAVPEMMVRALKVNQPPHSGRLCDGRLGGIKTHCHELLFNTLRLHSLLRMTFNYL